MLAVAAEVRASEREMEEGSVRSWEAVRRAACFWAKEVPWEDGAGGWSLGEEEEVGEVVIAPKRDWRLVIDGLWVVVVVGLEVEGVPELESFRHAFKDCELPWPPCPARPAPMPKPGTDTPALPSRPRAP